MELDVHMIVSTCRSLKEENKVVLKSLKIKLPACLPASVDFHEKNG